MQCTRSAAALPLPLLRLMVSTECHLVQLHSSVRHSSVQHSSVRHLPGAWWMLSGLSDSSAIPTETLPQLIRPLPCSSSVRATRRGGWVSPSRHCSTVRGRASPRAKSVSLTLSVSSYFGQFHVSRSQFGFFDSAGELLLWAVTCKPGIINKGPSRLL